MRIPFDWLKRAQARWTGRGPDAQDPTGARVGGGPSQLLTLLTPVAARGLHPAARFALGGAAAIGLAVAGTVGLLSLAGLFFAVALFYFLATEVLGLEIDLDPRAFYAEVQRQAAAYGPR